MPPLMLTKFLSAAETIWADIDSVVGLADGIGAFDTNRVCEIGVAAIAFD